jgi:hypothetical protein
MERRRPRADCLIGLGVPNSAATAADTSSPAAAARPVVGTEAAACAASSAEPMLCKFVAAVSNASGTAITNDISDLLLLLGGYPGFKKPCSL